MFEKKKIKFETKTKTKKKKKTGKKNRNARGYSRHIKRITNEEDFKLKIPTE